MLIQVPTKPSSWPNRVSLTLNNGTDKAFFQKLSILPSITSDFCVFFYLKSNKKRHKTAWRLANLDMTGDLFFDFWPDLSVNIINYDIKSSCLVLLNPLQRNKTTMERQSEHPTWLLCTTCYSRCVWLGHYLSAARARGNRAADSKMIGKWPTFPARGLVDRTHIVFVLLLPPIFVLCLSVCLWDYEQQTLPFRRHLATTGTCV